MSLSDAYEGSEEEDEERDQGGREWSFVFLRYRSLGDLKGRRKENPRRNAPVLLVPGGVCYRSCLDVTMRYKTHILITGKGRELVT